MGGLQGVSWLIDPLCPGGGNVPLAGLVGWIERRLFFMAGVKTLEFFFYFRQGEEEEEEGKRRRRGLFYKIALLFLSASVAVYAIFFGSRQWPFLQSIKEVRNLHVHLLQ